MPNKNIFIALLALTVTALACTSVSQFVGMPDRNDPGLNIKELEDDSISADATARAANAETDQDSGYQLTPEEAANQGQHTYTVDSTTSLGSKTETLAASHKFSEEGVEFVFGDWDGGFFPRVASNTYQRDGENATEQLIYTAIGFEFHQISSTGFETHNISTLQEP
jgi:hypothetical protein